MSLPTDLAEPVLQRSQVAHRRVEPDVEIFARRVGDLNAEIRRVAADVPVAQADAALGIALEPFAHLVRHLGLEAAVLRPVFQEGHAARVGQAEEEVLAGTQHGRGAGECRARMLQVGGGVDGAAGLAVVAVLVARAAVRAFALDEAVGQEHPLLGVVELLDGARLDEVVGAQCPINALREFVVLGAVGGMPVVEGDMEAFEIRLAAGGDGSHELLRRLDGLLGGDHDRRAVGVVGADEMHLVALQALETHPGVGLDVLHDVADVERPVGIGQGGGDEELARHEFDSRRRVGQRERHRRVREVHSDGRLR